MQKYPCPCCGALTYTVPAKEDCGYICPVCFWENDPFITSENEESDQNRALSLQEAKHNFARCGICDERLLPRVRHLRDGEGR